MLQKNSLLKLFPVFALLGFSSASLADNVYVVSQAASTLTVLDSQTLAVTVQTELPTGPFGLVHDPAKDYFYISHPEAGEISFIKRDGLALVATAVTGGQPFEMVLCQDFTAM